MLWPTVLGSQGHQASHIHPGGWLSGVYYVRLPAGVGGDDQAGWIEFGDPGAEIPHVRAPETRRARPEAGLMLLFPSYLFHRTLPFAANEPRISIAFDVLPMTAA